MAHIEEKGKRKQTLMQWIWKSFVKTALIPLIVIELMFIGIYFFTNEWSNSHTIDTLKKTEHKELMKYSEQEVTIIQQKIGGMTVRPFFTAAIIRLLPLKKKSLIVY